nr:uncharacterized protein LOC105327098 isoform X1 [Crassostrea gigas]
MKQLVSTFVLFFIFQSIHVSQEKNIVRMVIEKMSFLISVDRGQFGGRCSATIRTPMMTPGIPFNKSQEMNISNCDHGKLKFNVRHPKYPPDPKVASVVDVSFESFNVDNPPTCSIPWNFTYRWPTGKSYSALPGCFTKVVQPAFDFYLEHSFFFKIYDWKGHFENINETPPHF